MKATYFNSNTFFNTNESGVECELPTLSGILFDYNEDTFSLVFINGNTQHIFFDDMKFITFNVYNGRVSLNDHFYNKKTQPPRPNIKHLKDVVVTAGYGNLILKANGWMGIYLPESKFINDQCMDLVIINA